MNTNEKTQPESSGDVKELLTEATTLLKSLRPAASVKAIRISSLDVRQEGRALLDGGATHWDEPWAYNIC